MLLRRQDRTHRAPDRPRQVLLPVASAPLRQEPARRYPQGAVRRQRGAVRGAPHPSAAGLVGVPSGGAARFRHGRLRGVRLLARERDGAARRHRTRHGRAAPTRHRAGALRTPDPDPARAHRPARGGAGGRVRQAHPRRVLRSGHGPCRPPVSARPVRHDQVVRRAHRVRLPHRGQQVHQGEPLLRSQQPRRPHPRPSLRHHLRLHRRGSGHGVRARARRSGP